MTEEQAEAALSRNSFYGFDCEEGWFYHSHDGDIVGAFATEHEAIADAKER